MVVKYDRYLNRDTTVVQGTWETCDGSLAEVEYFVDDFQAWFGMIKGEIPCSWSTNGTACKIGWSLWRKENNDETGTQQLPTG
jgi:hypothetical protein